MKILVAPDTVQITSTLGRSTRLPVKTNRPPCFANIWIDCTTDAIYLGFTEGEIYRYDPDSVAAGRAIIKALNHGLTFNQMYRLFGVSGSTGTYSRVASVPGTAVLQYANPPYPGTDPGPCPTGIWTQMLWNSTLSGPAPGGYGWNPANGTMSDNANCHLDNPVTMMSTILSQIGTLTYTGPGTPAVANGELVLTDSPLGDNLSQVNLFQGPTLLFQEIIFGTATVPFSVPFTLLPGVGVNQAIQCNIGLGSGGAAPVTATLSAQVTFT